VNRTSFIVAAVCSTIVTGCSQSVATWQPPKGGAQNASTIVQKRPVTPESLIANLESKRERAAYLRELSKDSKFEPKQHIEMLQKYASDADPDVAGAAKELFDRAQ